MKKLLIVGILFSLFGNCFSQTKKPPLPFKKVDTTEVSDTSYAVILSKNELQWLENVIKSQDEKPSVINGQLEAINQKTRILLSPKKK